MTTDCKDCKIGKERGCEGCEQDLFNFDVVIKVGEAGVVFCAKMWK